MPDHPSLTTTAGDQWIMAAPTYSQQFSIGLLGTVGNLLSQPMSFYRCTVCGAVVAEGQSGTAGRDVHTAWHATLDAAATSAGAAKTAAGQALTAAQGAQHDADQALAMAQVALPGADVTLCPLCRATVNTNDLRTHLTYHYRRAHGDPVEFPTDFDPTTQDMAKVDPPMRVANQG